MTLTPQTVQQIQQNFIKGVRPNVQLSPEQRRIIDNFRPTRQEINEAYAKAIKVVNERAK
ncbi:hypothetical protein [Moraxella sp. Pampa]|uniref:hypothetical protein n=1 Tax=Moraxella sp. Pampa TaxID=3111978 RepID=UPI002B402DEB|nr:hypothetical protein [Moraxella sp. Pampa]